MNTQTKNITSINNDVTKELFVNVYGYEGVKAELKRIKDWLSDESNLNKSKIMLPKGVLFYGRPGNGKTLMLRDFANSFEAPIFVINGETENVCEEITQKFEEARKEKFALVLCDEIDLLIGKSSRVERILQQELDGINTKGSILVLATTNHIHNIDDALLRPGRFDRQIEIDYPDRKSRVEIIKRFVNELEVNDDKVDYEHVAKVCSRCSGAELRAVCNDAYLRCKNNFTTEEIEKSYDRIIHNNYEDKAKEFKDYRVAIHEAGHSIMALHFSENYSFYGAKFTSCGGITEVQDANERTDSVNKRKQAIMIAMSGYVAEEIFFGKHEVGSFNDYIRVQDQVQRLVERVCVNGISHLIPEAYYDNCDRHWSDKKVRKNQRLVDNLMKKLEKETRKYLTKHKTELEGFAKLMFQEGKCSYKEAQAFKA